MTLSKLAEATAWPLGKTPTGHNRYTKRSGKPDMFIVHHAAGTSDSVLKAQYTARNRELSSNYAMTSDAKIIPILHEEYRPFTSSSPIADGRAVTIEIVNIEGSPSWAGSEAQFDKLARLIADVATRWGFPITRSTVIMHREVRPLFGQGVATACPGPWWEARMGALCERARAYARGSVPDAVAPAPAPQQPAAGAFGSSEGLPAYGARVGRRVRLSGWYVWSDPAFRTGKRTVAGDYTIIGIDYSRGREARLHIQDIAGGKCWTRAIASKHGLMP